MVCWLSQIRPVVLRKRNFAPQGTLSNACRQPCLSQWGGMLLLSGRCGYTPTVHRTAPRISNGSAQNANHAKVGKLWARLYWDNTSTYNLKVLTWNKLFLLFLPTRSNAHVGSFWPPWEMFFEVVPERCRLPPLCHCVNLLSEKPHSPGMHTSERGWVITQTF